uniref:Growth arrest specific 1 n=1 Tax=Sphenodon punctatus TaxID=8508 RepID=A0A8D0GD57_SPHPU
MGCTEARRRCDWDSRCSAALNRYMLYCGKLFNGLRCTEECRAVIQDMLGVPKAMLLNDCVCDGLERPICESIKENMARLCFGADLGGSNGAGSSGGSDGGGLEDYYDEEYEDEPSTRRDEHEEAAEPPGFPRRPADGAGRAYAAHAACWTFVASILLPRLLL